MYLIFSLNFRAFVRHINYEGEDIIKTNLTMMSQEDESHNYIEAYSIYGFKLASGFRILGPCALFPKAVLHWGVSIKTGNRYTWIYCYVSLLSIVRILFRFLFLCVCHSDSPIFFLGASIVCVNNLKWTADLVLWFPDRTAVCNTPLTLI